MSEEVTVSFVSPVSGGACGFNSNAEQWKMSEEVTVSFDSPVSGGACGFNGIVMLNNGG